MNTPILDFAREYACRQTLRLHMPGHKGRGQGPEALDLTEIEGADVLYHSRGIIQESQENAAALFGTAKTIYSAEGSSLGIRAMLYLAMVYGKQQGRAPRIVAGRNAHKTFMTGAALLDLEVIWLYPEDGDSMLSCRITGEQLERLLSSMEEKPIGVYVTTPDYLGNLVDLRPLAEVCQKYDVLLLADNAHGAYLHFLPQPCHPMDQGADLCCDSAHKTLPVLTGGAYLHISGNAPSFFAENGELAMSVFASTSPSYLILESLDGANGYLSRGYRERLGDFTRELSAMKERLGNKGFVLLGSEALKLTIAPKSLGYLGTELAELLERENIVCEFADPDSLVMMFTPELTKEELERVENVLLSVERRKPVFCQPPTIPRSEKRLSVREALFSPSEELPVELCKGEILANVSITCPPAVPILICGEEITEEAVACLKYYGITHCRVVRRNLPAKKE